MKQVVEAERDAKVKVTAAQAANEQTILAAKAENQKAILGAEAEKQKLILEANGQKEASIAKAEGVLALGKAEAEAQKLRLSAYAVPGAEAFVRVEVAKQQAEAFKNVRGFLPSDLKFSILAKDFNQAVDAVTGGVVIPVK